MVRPREVTAVVLAGGRGTRVQALHPDKPKPMIPVAGRPILHWITAWLALHGIDDVVYSTGYRGDQIERWCADASFPSLQRRVVHEHEPLGTGGGLLNCLAAARPWVLVLNGDSLCLGGLDALLAPPPGSGRDGGLLGLEVADASRYGTLDLDGDGRLLAFHEKRPGRAVVNCGVYLLRVADLLALGWRGPASMERDLFPLLLARGASLHVARLPDTTPFIDFGTPETLAIAEAFLAANAARFSSSAD